MQRSSLEPAIACLRDAATQPELWPAALPLIAHAMHAVGAACFARNDLTDGVEWAYFFGPATQHKAQYVEYYSRLDLYLPILAESAVGPWQALSHCLPGERLNHSEWYQDFIIPCGLRDVVGAQLHQAGTQRVYFGVHYDTPLPVMPGSDLKRQRLLEELRKTVQLASAQRTMNLKTILGDWMLRASDRPLFVTYDSGRVVGMNAAAERLLADGLVLAVRMGRLVAIDSTENQQLATLLGQAAQHPNAPSVPTRLLLGRSDGRPRQILTISPLPGALSDNEQPLVIVFADAVLDEAPSTADLARLFGLSPAEERLAKGLLRGRTLQELTQEFGLQMPTLRAQLRSVLRKCGVRRQVDLLQVLRTIR